MDGAASYGMPSPVITGVGEGAYRRCGEFRGTLRSSWDALLPRNTWSPPCILFSYAHNNLKKKLIEDVVGGEDFIVISRRDAPNAVLLSLDSFNSLMETVHLLKSPANAARLARFLAQMEQR